MGRLGLFCVMIVIGIVVVDPCSRGRGRRSVVDEQDARQSIRPHPKARQGQAQGAEADKSGGQFLPTKSPTIEQVQFFQGRAGRKSVRQCVRVITRTIVTVLATEAKVPESEDSEAGMGPKGVSQVSCRDGAAAPTG